MNKHIFIKVGVVIGFVLFFALGGVIGSSAIWVLIGSITLGVIIDLYKTESSKKVNEEDYYYDVNSIDKLCYEIGRRIVNGDKKIDIYKGSLNYKSDNIDGKELHCVHLDGDINRKIISVFSTKEIGEKIVGTTNGKYVMNHILGDTYTILPKNSSNSRGYERSQNYLLYQEVANKLVEYYNNGEERTAFVSVFMGEPVDGYNNSLVNLKYYYSVHISINEVKYPVQTEIGDFNAKFDLQILKFIADSTGGIYESDNISTISLTETSFSKLLETKKKRMAENEDVRNWCDLIFENGNPEYFSINFFELVYGKKFGEQKHLRFNEYGYNNMSRCEMFALAEILNKHANNYYFISEEENIIEMVKRKGNDGAELKKW